MKKKLMGLLLSGSMLLLSACGNEEDISQEEIRPSPEADMQEVSGNGDTDAAGGYVQGQTGYVTEGTEEYRGFILDNVLHSESEGDIHYNLYIPDSYDGSEAYALFFTLPGYEGLYFQGVGENLYSENFGFAAQEYVQDMIVVALQLGDWGETSANQAIALAEYFLTSYNIDRSRVYAEGYSRRRGNHVPGHGEAPGAFRGLSPLQFPVGWGVWAGGREQDAGLHCGRIIG